MLYFIVTLTGARVRVFENCVSGFDIFVTVLKWHIFCFFGYLTLARDYMCSIT